jgi:hypothetical protein
LTHGDEWQVALGDVELDPHRGRIDHFERDVLAVDQPADRGVSLRNHTCDGRGHGVAGSTFCRSTDHRQGGLGGAHLGSRVFALATSGEQVTLGRDALGAQRLDALVVRFGHLESHPRSLQPRLLRADGGALEDRERRAFLHDGTDVGADRSHDACHPRVHLSHARRVVDNARGCDHLTADRLLDRLCKTQARKARGVLRLEPHLRAVRRSIACRAHVRCRTTAQLGMADGAERLGEAVLVAPVTACLEDRDQRRIALGADRLEHTMLRAHRAVHGRLARRRSRGGLQRGGLTASSERGHRERDEDEQCGRSGHASCPGSEAAE